MKGLFYKDLCLLCTQARMTVAGGVIIILLGGVFANASGSFLMLYGGLMLGMLPMALLSYEEREGWQSYVKTMPLSSKQIVGEKYLLGLIVSAAGMALSALAMGISALCGYVWPANDIAEVLPMAMLISLLDSTFALPLSCRFGTGKGTMVLYFFIGVWTVVMFLFGFDYISPTKSAILANQIVLIVAEAVLYALSWRLSVAWYDKKRD